MQFFQYFESGGDRFQGGIVKGKSQGHQAFGPSCCGWERLQKEQGEERSELGLGPVESAPPNRPPNGNVKGAEEVLLKSMDLDSAVVGTST